jgi:hypothetical protein
MPDRSVSCRSPSSFAIVTTPRPWSKGNFVWRGRPAPVDTCRAASGGEPLVLSAATVSRTVVLLECDEVGEWVSEEVEAQIALARCPHCGTRRRVLPCDVIPRKQYSLTVIAGQVATYARGELSLREVAWNLLGDRTPSHTTLHGWTEGLGAHALGLPSGDVGGLPFSRVLAEAEVRLPPVRSVWEAPYAVDERRYHSEPRRERLAAVARVDALAHTLTGQEAPHGWVACRRLIVGWTDSCVWVFPSRLLDTAIEHRRGLNRRSCRRRHQQNRHRCLTRTRSPPGASSRSPP